MAVGLVPINFATKSSESALSVYPVAIANCAEKKSVLLLVVFKSNCYYLIKYP